VFGNPTAAGTAAEDGSRLPPLDEPPADVPVPEGTATACAGPSGAVLVVDLAEAASTTTVGGCVQ
jgi:hypothetical protein